MRLDTTKLTSAIRQLADITKRGRGEVCREAAKGFVKNIVAITPPASRGVTGGAAKKAGENAVAGDLARMARVVPASVISRSELMQIHKDKRGRNGGIQRMRKSQRTKVTPAVFNAVVRVLKKDVGTLSAGWVAAAAQLGVSIPAWVKRHGSSRGDILITHTPDVFRIAISNAVPFVLNVRDLERRVQASVNYQSNAMNRKAAFLIKRAAQKSGWK